MTQLLIAAYFIEAGVLLVVAPWTPWWRQNFFAAAFPWVHAITSQPAATVIVVAIGAAAVICGVSDLKVALVRRFSKPGRATEESSPS